MNNNLPVTINGKALFWNKGGKRVLVSDLEEGLEFIVVKFTDTLLYIERKLNG